MKSPIKICHKFKNNNRRIQYKIYIFIGPLVPSNVMKILEYIQDKDFSTMLLGISTTDYKVISKYYGEYWYEFFYITYHLDSQKKMIRETKQKTSTLQNKFSKEWFDLHFTSYKGKTAPYSYANEYFEFLL